LSCVNSRIFQPLLVFLINKNGVQLPNKNKNASPSLPAVVGSLTNKNEAQLCELCKAVSV
jgi:hypothetical protein